MFARALGRSCNGGSSFSIFRLRFSTNTAAKAPTTSTDFLSDYLADTLGFSKQESISMANKVSLYTSTTRAISVIDFMKKLGFDSTQIRECISKFPKLLNYGVDKNLGPKIQCLLEIGLSGSDIARIIARSGYFLGRRLDTIIKPNLDSLRLVYGNNEDVCRAIMVYPGLLHIDSRLMRDNISYLHTIGFSSERIRWYVSKRPMALRFHTQWFEERVSMMENDLGIPRGSTMLFYGLFAMGSASRSSMKKKFAAFRRFGWIDSDITTVFRHQPFYFTLSVANIEKKLDFFMNKLGFTPKFLCSGSALTYSLEKRVMPRVNVLNALKEKNFPVKKRSFYTIICLTESKFEEIYLLPYKDAVPGLYESYQRLVRR